MASTRLYRTQGTPTNADKWTFSVWVKSSNADAVNEGSWMGTYVDSSNYEYVGFNSEKKINFYSHQSGSRSCTLKKRIESLETLELGIISFMCGILPQSAADRMRIYVNGVEETSLATDTNPALNLDSLINTSGNVINIGTYKDSGAVANEFFQGVMAHAHFCDGQAYAASDFGETDATSGIWIAKTGPSVTYGDNGFFLKFASGALGTDSSGEGNNMTVTGTMTNTKDTPENNFCTMNPLQNEIPNATFTQGNNTIKTDFNAPPTSTIGLDSGKWYCEGKCIVTTSGTDWQIGINSNYMDGTGNELGHFANDWAYQGSDGNSRTNNTSTSYGDTYTTGDIIGIALDLTNNKLYFSKNGVWQDSGDPISGATGTGALSISLGTGAQAKGYFFIAAGADSSAQDYTWSMNFGNGYFGTTAISSGNADDAGEGDFEYDVPAVVTMQFAQTT